jgi:hypothetical protein
LPTHGTLFLNTNGTFTYVPNPYYTGTDQFIYQECDNGVPVACDKATVYITIFPINLPPVAINDFNNTLKNVPVSGNVLTNDFDPDHNALTVVTMPVTPPVHGTVSLNTNGNYTYTPATGYVGTDSFVYRIFDNGIPSLTATALVYITVIKTPDSLNRPPVGNPDNYIGLVNLPINGNVIVNDFDPDGNAISVSPIPSGGPLHGVVNLQSSGVFIYTPVPGYIGTDSFFYTLCDNGIPSLCVQVPVTLTIIPNPGNTTVAVDDGYGTNENTPISGNVKLNDYDPEGNLQTASLITGPAHGSLNFTNGIFTYTPNINYVGPDEFVYMDCDNGIPVACDSATVHITVIPTHQPPVALNDFNNTLMDIPVTGNVLTNDFDPQNAHLSSSLISGPVHGSVTLNGDGTYTYTPSAGYTGLDSLNYQACNNLVPSLCDTAVVYITIIDNNHLVNRPPVANPDVYP